MSRFGRGVSRVRVVGYGYEVPDGFSESAVEAELQRAVVECADGRKVRFDVVICSVVASSVAVRD